MTFSEKIRTLRKEKGLSQETLADMLGVSRQAVSKWESEQGYPETEKIVQLSSVFGVSLDYLLKEDSSSKDESGGGFYASKEAVNAFVLHKRQAGTKTALGVAIIIMGAATSLLLEGQAIAVVPLFVAIAIGVIIFVTSSFNSSPYPEMETELLIFDPAFFKNYSLEAKQTSKKMAQLMAGGIGIIILAMGGFSFLEEAFPALENKMLAIAIFAVAVGVYLIIVAVTHLGALEIILKNDEFLRSNDKGKRLGWIWLIVTMIFLLIGFLTGYWHPAWVVFPITAAIFVALK